MIKLKDIFNFSGKKQDEEPSKKPEKKIGLTDNTKGEVRKSKYSPCCTVSYHLAVSNNHPLIQSKEEE